MEIIGQAQISDKFRVQEDDHDAVWPEGKPFGAGYAYNYIVTGWDGGQFSDGTKSHTIWVGQFGTLKDARKAAAEWHR